METELKDKNERSGHPNAASPYDRCGVAIRPHVIREHSDSDFGRLARRLRQLAGDATLLIAEQPVAAKSRVRALALMWAAIDELESSVGAFPKLASHMSGAQR